MWVATADLPKSAGHPFYERLNRTLDEAGFDAFVEAQCAAFYADGVGRPSLAPGRYFRLLLLGYFEGLDSERAIAWRAADSLSIREFLDFALHEAPPDHSTLSRTRRLIDLETHQAVFTWVLQRLADAHLVQGYTVGIDATTLEANAAMRSIVRRDTGEGYDAWLTRLAEASGIATPSRAELARFDRTRKKKGSNDNWTSPHDPDAKITKMKDRADASGPYCRARGRPGDGGHCGRDGAGRGRGRHDDDGRNPHHRGGTGRSGRRRRDCRGRGRQGVSQQRDDGRLCRDRGAELRVGAGSRAAQVEGQGGGARGGVCQSAADSGRARGRRLLRQRGELLERPNAHLYEPGRMRRVHLRGHPNILKRVLVHVSGFNLGLLMRQLTGVGTPRSLQGRAAAVFGALIAGLSCLWTLVSRSWAPEARDRPDSSCSDPVTRCHEHLPIDLRRAPSTTGC